MTHRIRVAGLVRNGNEFLLIQQQDRFGDLHWSLPGGRLEATDADMFRGAEREVLEETGLRVKAGQLLFISEYSAPDLFALTLIVDCVLEQDEDPANIHLNNTMEDDNIHNVAWWSIDNIRGASSGMSRILANHEFWLALDNPTSVVHLGRHEDAGKIG